MKDGTKVMCSDCEHNYTHQFPIRIVCPKCGCSEYEYIVETVKEEVVQTPILEHTAPRLLLE